MSCRCRLPPRRARSRQDRSTHEDDPDYRRPRSSRSPEIGERRGGFCEFRAFPTVVSRRGRQGEAQIIVRETPPWDGDTPLQGRASQAYEFTELRQCVLEILERQEK